MVPPAGLEPAHLAPEASALSTELRGWGGETIPVGAVKQQDVGRPAGGLPWPSTAGRAVRGCIEDVQRRKWLEAVRLAANHRGCLSLFIRYGETPARTVKLDAEVLDIPAGGEYDYAAVLNASRTRHRA